jgi:hypothetical protein
MAAPMLPCGSGFNQEKKMAKMKTLHMKTYEYEMLHHALMIYIAMVTEEYHEKPSKIRSKRMEKAVELKERLFK